MPVIERRPLARVAGLVAVAATLVLLVVAVRAHTGGSAPPRQDGVADRAPSSAPETWVASARPGTTEVPVFDAPNPASASRTFPSPTAAGDPLVFLVDGTDVARDWLPVFLPVRPNGSRGWVRAADVALSPDDYRIEVALGDHELEVLDRGKVKIETPIGVGTANTPTPGGTYFLKELVQPPDPYGAYGPYVYGLSGFSENPDLADFNGGDGTIGIHGTNDPSSIGNDVSHGCIRVPNDVILKMVDILPLGTPVDIRA